jgi:hypothetical protein
MTLDARDATPEPPAYLDPLWVLLMRERIRNFQETGKIEDWYPAKTPGPSAEEEP